MWKGSADKCQRAKVKWSDICCSVQEDGLGLTGLEDRNMALIMRFVRQVAAGRANSLWLKWIKD